MNARAQLGDTRFKRHLLLIGTALALLGCDKGTPPAPASSLPAPVFGAAAITGQVRFLGTPPELKIIDTAKCHANAVPMLEESVVVGANQGLKDVIVYVKDAPASVGAAQPTLELDQVDCVYKPHVLAIQVNQPLKILNSDPTFHNSHWLSERNGDVNIGLSQDRVSEPTHFAHSEFIRVRCDVHAWMEAWIGVMSNPFFATTAKDGSFTISKLPPGHYTLGAWHPILGEREIALDVTESGGSPVTIDYAPPAKP